MNWNLRIALGLVGLLAIMFIFLWSLGAATRADLPGNGGDIPPAGGPMPEDTRLRSDFELTTDDHGEGFGYPVASRFTVILPQGQYRAEDVRCSPEGIIGRISNMPDVPSGFFAVRFETLREGDCMLRAGNWQVEIFVSEE